MSRMQCETHWRLQHWLQHSLKSLLLNIIVYNISIHMYMLDFLSVCPSITCSHRSHSESESIVYWKHKGHKVIAVRLKLKMLFVSFQSVSIHSRYYTLDSWLPFLWTQWRGLSLCLYQFFCFHYFSFSMPISLSLLRYLALSNFLPSISLPPSQSQWTVGSVTVFLPCDCIMS